MLRPLLTGLLVALLASRATAEQPAYKAVVTDEEVKLRAGPSDQSPETGTLRKGATVVVEKEDSNGWLAVSAYGSVSWIAAQFIEDPTPDKPGPKNVFVSGTEEVTLAAGKVEINQPLDSRRVKIPEGTTVLVLGPKVTFNGKTWYMIQSPPGDLRYLPKTAVQLDKPASNNFTVRINESVTPLPSGGSPAIVPALPSGPATPAAGVMTGGSGAGVMPAAGGVTSAKPAVNHPLWTQAEAAERDNRLKDAEKLYFQLAEEMNRPNGDHDIANLCYTRIHALLEKQRGVRTAVAQTSPPNVLKPPVREDASPRPREERGVKVGTPEPLPPAAVPGDRDSRAEWQTGVLRRSNLTPDGPNRQLYLLETPQGIVKMYVTAAPGVELDRYLTKRVNLLGSPTSRTGLSKPYLVATDAEAAQ